MPTSSGGTAYSAQEVYDLMLRSGQESFTFDWLDQNLNYKGDLSSYVTMESVPQLSYDATAAVKRSLRFQTLGMPAGLNPLTDLVRPHYRLAAPDGGWLDWALGTLTLNPPRKTIAEGYSLYDWTAADLADLLVQDEFLDSFSVPGGTAVIDAVKALLASMRPPIATLIIGGQRPLVLRDSLSWDAGKSKLEAINDLLEAVSLRPAWFDEWGNLCSQEIPNYNLEVAPITWNASVGLSPVLSNPLSEDPDMSSVINICKVIGTDPRLNIPIVAVYENSRPDSPVSTSRLQRRRVKVIQDSKIADQASAQIRAMAEVQAGARIYGKFSLETLHWPAWQDYDLLHLIYSSSGEGVQDWNYLVLGWSMQMVPGGTTSHTLQRIVNA
jgi:hypothetical protein